MNWTPRRPLIPLRAPATAHLTMLILSLTVPSDWVSAKDGMLTLEALEESSDEPVITRLELRRGNPDGMPLPVRRAVSAGVGVVLDRSIELSLPEDSYSFRLIRGPEYRIVSGSFDLEKTSLDSHRVALPRMVDMLSEGWVSGDCLVPASRDDLKLRMAAEDLHMATTDDDLAPYPIPGRKPNDEVAHEPCWISSAADHQGGLVFYGTSSPGEAQPDLAVARLANLAGSGEPGERVAIENPFAWPLPVWLASDRIDGVFLLGDWLRLDRQVLVPPGRKIVGPGPRGGTAVGHWAERIYWNLLDAGFRLPPLAGTGSDASGTPVGYNRLYVRSASSDNHRGGRVANAHQWWEAAWDGRSVATNGPLLRPSVGGEIPGHVFQATSGEKLQLTVELDLAVRDPVDYLEVIYNGKVHHSARLDEFARSGGHIPDVIAERSGWILVRVVTGYPDHFRAAISAPWYIEFDGQRRISRDAVDFFVQWLGDYEQRLRELPPDQLRPHVPFIRAARRFWAERATAAAAFPAES